MIIKALILGIIVLTLNAPVEGDIQAITGSNKIFSAEHNNNQIICDSIPYHELKEQCMEEFVYD